MIHQLLNYYLSLNESQLFFEVIIIIIYPSLMIKHCLNIDRWISNNMITSSLLIHKCNTRVTTIPFDQSQPSTNFVLTTDPDSQSQASTNLFSGFWQTFQRYSQRHLTGRKLCHVASKKFSQNPKKLTDQEISDQYNNLRCLLHGLSKTQTPCA